MPARKQTREAAPVSAAPAARALLRAPSLYLADRARAGAANVRPGEISPFLAAYLWAESAPFHEHLRPSYLAPRPRVSKLPAAAKGKAKELLSEKRKQVSLDLSRLHKQVSGLKWCTLRYK